MSVNIHFNRNPGGYELANNLETEISGVAALDAVQGKKLNEKIESVPAFSVDSGSYYTHENAGVQTRLRVYDKKAYLQYQENASSGNFTEQELVTKKDFDDVSFGKAYIQLGSDTGISCRIYYNGEIRAIDVNSGENYDNNYRSFSLLK